MRFFVLDPNNHIFPHPELAGEDGLLAFGGDLSPERLLSAYSFGIFPWYNEEDPILWWSPDPRAVVFPGKVKCSKSMRPFLKKYELRIDHSFKDVISNCSMIPRKGFEGSWITDEMMEAYISLHEKGYAHSFETWYNGELIGGLYGVSLGRCFFGESMFSTKSNASKFAFIKLSEILLNKDFLLIDCQIPNEHLSSMGCENIPRKEYLKLLRKNLFMEDLNNSWSKWI